MKHYPERTTGIWHNKVADFLNGLVRREVVTVYPLNGSYRAYYGPETPTSVPSSAVETPEWQPPVANPEAVHPHTSPEQIG